MISSPNISVQNEQGASSAPPRSHLLTVEEAAQRIHQTVRPNTIRAAIHRGQISAMKIGRRYYISEIEIERFIQCQDIANPPAFTNAKTTALGSSSTAENRYGQDLLENFVQKQRKH